MEYKKLPSPFVLFRLILTWLTILGIINIMFICIGEGTHYKKRLMQSATRGMIPITNNIIVTDEVGNEYGLTYLRRANGLIKKGRARWLDDFHTKICLTCPPQKEVEELNIDININNAEEKESLDSEQPLQLKKEILERIDRIMSDNLHIIDALETLKHMCPSNPNDFAGQAKADAIGKVVASRETTNQQLIRLLERMYNDLSPQRPDNDSPRFGFYGRRPMR